MAADASELVPQMGGARGHDVGLTLIFLLLSICIQVGKGWQLARSISSRRKGMLLLPACQAVLPHTDLPSSTEAVIHGWRFLAQLAKVRANILSMSTSRFPKTGIGRRFYSFNLPPNFYAQEFLIFNQKHREPFMNACDNNQRISDESILQEGRNVLSIERDAIEAIDQTLGQPFIDAVRLILGTKGNVIFSGVGKSGHIGRKLAATFSSTGTTAFFVHSDEAAHGDLGMVKKDDVFVAISFSGESDELLTILPALKTMGVKIICMTGRADSSLAKASDVSLVTPITREACPLNLAPTSSTTVTMALGDAIAGACMVAKHFSREDFARSHPAGALGRRLLLKVQDVMRNKSLPVVQPQTPLLDAIEVLSKGRLGVVFAVDADQKPEGVFTEGDLCRLLRKSVDLSNLSLFDVMKTNPKSVSPKAPAHAALHLIQDNQINQLAVVDDETQQLCGIVHIQDLIARKIY